MAKTKEELKKEIKKLKARIALLEANIKIAKNYNYAEWERVLLYEDDGIAWELAKELKQRKSVRDRGRRRTPMTQTEKKSKRAIKKEIYGDKPQVETTPTED